MQDFVEQYLTVLAENVECNMRSSRKVTCTKSATVIVNGTNPIDLKQNQIVFVDGEETILPYTNGEVVVRRASSKFIFVEGNGFLVKWDGINRLYVTLYPEYINRVGYTFDFELIKSKCYMLAPDRYNLVTKKVIAFVPQRSFQHYQIIVLSYIERQI